MNDLRNNDQRNNELVDAQTRQRVANDLRTNFLVEAAAGTGKTTNIVERMVNLIATGECEISRLVAVTFTRKAAAELLERFEAKLRSRASEPNNAFDAQSRERMLDACNRSNQAFVGTMHSFCASLLRERPIEFSVDPAFRELTEEDDKQLKSQAWHDNIHNLMAEHHPLLDQMSELGLVRDHLQHCYYHLVSHRDIRSWPTSEPQPVDLEQIQQQVQNYIERMRSLAPNFPAVRGNDKLMEHYEEILRASQRDWTRPAKFIQLLEKFDTTPNTVQGAWISKAIGKEERDFWAHFRTSIAKPALAYWYAKRYPLVLDFVQRAVEIYEKHKRLHAGLDFTDLLLRIVDGLRHQPELRAYFQARYTHILVDEFQDTDPVQAEMLTFLCSQDRDETNWSLCGLRPGALFLVGDPKQSIYRFRRGDIVTYNRMRELIENSNGEVLSLAKNFRSQATIREWNNKVYRRLFGTSATIYSPAAEDMLQGREEVLHPAPNVPSLSGLYRLPVAQFGRAFDTAGEADAIARTIHHAINGGFELSRTRAETEQGRTSAIEPRDFLIIPPAKKSLPIYKAALDRYNIPCDVTGGNAVADIAELQLLTNVLLCVDDPYDRVAFLAILREQLFGFNDQELYELRMLGATFVYTAPIDATNAGDAGDVVIRYQQVCARLSEYASWLRNLPYTVGVTRIAEDLGLLAGASSRDDGNIAAGGFLKAIEWLRCHANDFDSIVDVVGSIDQLRESNEFEGCSALSPDANAVRLMNLHKAKGLEAPVVFLVDVYAPTTHAVHSHVDRSDQADTKLARGYLSVHNEINRPPRQKHFKPVACPANWETYQAVEQAFLDAEKDRLLYVATTRAGNALVISTGNDKSVWAKLYPDLDNAQSLPVPKLQSEFNSAPKQQATHIATRGLTHCNDEIISKADSDFVTTPPPFATSELIRSRWEATRIKSYDIQSAKSLALRGVSRPRFETTGEYGYRWGSAVHELFEICTKSTDADLRAFALDLAREHGLAHDRIDELVSTVRSVTQSDMWRRAQCAPHCYSELPMEALITNPDGLPTIFRGVIDLIFEESTEDNSATSWVIVDYKTDDITLAEVPAANDYYRSQLAHYAMYWTSITGNAVKEMGLYFTKHNRYESIQ